MLETIVLTRQDTLGSILARLQAAQADRILFVVPRKLTLTVADLLMLPREAAAVKRQVALLTSNVTLRRRAAEAGINVFRSRWWAMRMPWRTVYPRPPRRSRPPSPGGIEAPFGQGLYSPHSPTGFAPCRSGGRSSAPRVHGGSSWGWPSR